MEVGQGGGGGGGLAALGLCANLSPLASLLSEPIDRERILAFKNKSCACVSSVQSSYRSVKRYSLVCFSE